MDPYDTPRDERRRKACDAIRLAVNQEAATRGLSGDERRFWYERETQHRFKIWDQRNPHPAFDPGW